MNISDEAVEAAAKAIWGRSRVDSWEASSDNLHKEACRLDARLALDAAAPFIAEQALKSAADSWREYLPAVAGYGKVRPVPVWLERRAQWHARG